jgi:hypothetical protein
LLKGYKTFTGGGYKNFSPPSLVLSGMSTAVKRDPAKWKATVARVKASPKGGDPGEWSARKAQLAVQQYKKSGGTYEGPKKADNSLAKWTDQKWRTSDNKPSEGKKRYLPDKAWSSLSKSETVATNRAKAAGNAAGKQFVKQPTEVARKAARFR